jgi:cytochrome bd-type quinol oxidase subunit 2
MIEKLSAFADLVTPFHLWVAFILALVYTLSFSLILIYHWRNYGTNAKAILAAESLYSLVTAGLLVALATTISLFSSLT